MRIDKQKKKQKYEKKKIITLLLSFVLTVLVAAISFVFIQLLQFKMDISLLGNLIIENPPLVILNIFILWIIQIPIVFLIGNAIKSSAMYVFIIVLIGVGNYQKMLYRPEPIYPSDILMLSDIKFLFFSVERIVQIIILIVIGVFIFSLFLLSKSSYVKRANIINNFYIRIITFAISLIIFFPLISFNKPNNIVKNSFEKYANVSWISFNQVKNYERNGVVAGFLYNLSGQAIN